MTLSPRRKSNPTQIGTDSPAKIFDFIELRKTTSDSSIDVLKSMTQDYSPEILKIQFKHSMAPLMVRDLRGNVDVNDIPEDMGIVLPKGLSQRKIKIVSVNEMDTERSAHTTGRT